MTATPPARVRLEPLTEAEFESWMGRAIPAYAMAHVAEGNWSAAGALRCSQEAHAGLLPEGLRTPGHSFASIVREPGGERVGLLWWARAEAAGRRGVHVYLIEIDEPARRQGCARAALAELERQARQQGLSFVGLHVFGRNAAARALYELAGYTPTDITMRKNLE